MEARYIGDPQRKFEGPRTTNAFGQVFVKGAWASVSKMDEKFVAKLKTNSHFQVREDGAEAPPLPKGVTFEAPAEETLLEELGDHSQPAKGPAADAGAPMPTDKEGLIAELKLLGANFHHNWGVPKLTQALEQARFVAGDSEEED